MHDLKFVHAVASARILRRRKIFKNSFPCQHAHDVYMANTDRTKALLVVPGYAFLLGSVWQSATDRAVKEVLGADQQLEKTQTRIDEIGARTGNYFNQIMGHPENDERAALQAMSVNLEGILNGTELRHALELTLKSVLIQSWSAFEILCEQLLTLALEKHAKCFPTQVHTASSKFRYRKLSSIQGAYRTAFNCDHDIDTILADLMVKSGALLRHLLVHCGGEVDQRFLDQCKEQPQVAMFDRWKKGSRIEVDGEMTALLVNTTMHSGFALIEHVYTWIQAHKPPHP